jgi:glutamate formiminotransferase
LAGGATYGAVVECVPNFATASPGQLLEVAGWRLTDTSFDASHGRSVLTLAGAPSGALDAAFQCVATAVESLSLAGHEGVHPRVGVADVVPFAPLAGVDVAACAELAAEFAARAWESLRVPVYLYGRQFGGLRLAQIRSAVAAGNPLAPSVGGPAPHPTAGYCCVGARPPLVAYNVLLNGVSMPAARDLAGSLRELSHSGRGLPGVQALAFEVAAGVQLSMNLVDLAVVTPGLVLAEVRQRVGAIGGSVAGDEVVGLCPAGACEPWTPAIAGQVLEARVAAAAARSSAASARGSLAAAGGSGARRAEVLGVAVRLDRAAEELAGVASTESFLAAAEQSAALLRVLAAGRMLQAEPAALLQYAADALLASAPAGVGARFEERVAALRRWLAAPPEPAGPEPAEP